jgi:uncharacterized protein (TIRG00374 family)
VVDDDATEGEEAGQEGRSPDQQPTPSAQPTSLQLQMCGNASYHGLSRATGTSFAPVGGVRASRILVLAGSAVGLLALVFYLGAESITSTLSRLAWWEFALICLLYAVNMTTDTLGWQVTLPRRGAPLPKLLAARCAGEAANVLTALASVGGEALKAWLLRVEIPYEESIPSLVVAKTAEVTGQILLLATAVLVGWTTGVIGPPLLTAMTYLLIVEVIAVGAFLWIQIAGVLGKVCRLLVWAGFKQMCYTERLAEVLSGFYRRQWRRFLLSTAIHFVGWMIGTLEALFILYALELSASFALSIVLEALWSGVRFATFFIPASLGPLEGVNAGVFATLGFGATAGLAFTLIRRARQAVWVGLGLLILFAMRPTRARATASVLTEVAAPPVARAA